MTSHRSETDPGNDLRPPTPRWVKVFGILVGLLALVFIIMHLTGNSLGNHGSRYYWVLFKLLIAVVGTGFLLLHMQPTSDLAEAAANETVSTSELRGIRIQLLVYSVAAVLVLIAATVLSIYKPRGLTPYGWRKERENHSLALYEVSR